MDSQSTRQSIAGLPHTTTLTSKLEVAIRNLHQIPYPHVPNPPSCKKRASVALVIRIRPTFGQKALYNSDDFNAAICPSKERLDKFFAQDWVRHGEPEILFIKRAARKGDRWTSHIAFPGGKREPDDVDDRSTSARETREEVGLDLDMDHFILVGNLAERIVTTSWGKVPLMVLCPFVYLAVRYDLPPLTLQPSEVGSAHWVSIRVLLSPSLRTFERCDVSDRMTWPGHQILRVVFRTMLGKMIFPAVKLMPSESVYSSSAISSSSEVRTSETSVANVYSMIKSWCFGSDIGTDILRRPLHLWGLTLGITADFLGFVSLEDASNLWAWPTLSPWDIRALVWIITHNFRMRRLRASSHSAVQDESKDAGTQEVEIGGLDSETFTTSVKQSSDTLRLIAGEVSLDGYFDLVRNAVLFALSARLCVGSLVLILLSRRYRKQLR